MSKGRPVLRSQARMIIYNVLKFMQKEKDEGVHDVKQVQRRTAEATGISIRTVRSIISEFRRTDIISAFRSSGKKKSKPKPVTGLDSFEKGVIKRCIHNFHLTEKEMPTIKKLLVKLQADIGFRGSASSLSKIIKELGFKTRRIENNRKVLIEKHEIRLKRILFLQKLKKYRDEGRPIVYTDETYVHPCHSQAKHWPGYQGAKTNKGQKIIIVHAGSKDGFVPNALLMFKSGSKTGEYHDEMTFGNYEAWLKTKLIPNLRPNSVIVIDNAPYHNKLRDPVPTSSSKKMDMELWLANKGIPFNQNMLKPQLYELICQNKSSNRHYLIDDILLEHNHTVLRLPPYHPDLNPLEMAWTDVKDFVAQYNIDFNINQTMQLIEEKLILMASEEWPALCTKVKGIEDQYRVSDHIIDTLTEHIVIYTGDNSETESEDEDSDISDLEETIPDCSTSIKSNDIFVKGLSPLPSDSE